MESTDAQGDISAEELSLDDEEDEDAGATDDGEVGPGGAAAAAARCDFTFVEGRGLLPVGASVVDARDGVAVESAQVFLTPVADSELDRYGLYTWRSAVVLARWVWCHRADRVRGNAVCELGAGTALPGLLAAKVGASTVVLTDRADAPGVLRNCASGCRLNALDGERVTVMGLDWGFFDTDFDALPSFDLILGADVFYEPDDFEDAVATVGVLLRRGLPTAVFVTTYQNRSPDRFLQPLLDRHGLQCSEVPLRAVYAESEQDDADAENETIHLLVFAVTG
jgi:predicted nicotinamide N-methyase